MNVEKMRHQCERTGAAEADAARARRWAAMTPEHRARHTGPFGVMPCGLCIGEAMTVAVQQMMSVMVPARDMEKR